MAQDELTVESLTAYEASYTGVLPRGTTLGGSVYVNERHDLIVQIRGVWSCPSFVETQSCCEEEVSAMSKTRPPYPAAFRQQMVELVRSGRTPGDLAREFATLECELLARTTLSTHAEARAAVFDFVEGW